MRTLLAALAGLMLLSACGFQPLHARHYDNPTNIDLTTIQVVVDHSHDGQLLEAEIRDAINPDYLHHEKLYRLQANISSTEVKLFINPDGTSSRSDIPLTSAYKLTRIADGKLVDQGAITRLTSYNTSSADYSSYVSLQDAKKRGVEELAQNYKLRLANIMASLPERTLPDENAPRPVPVFPEMLSPNQRAPQRMFP